MQIKSRKRWLKKALWSFAIIFLLMNIIAFFHAYLFTHFTESNISKTDSPSELSAFQKVGVLLTGVNNPRPVNNRLPDQNFETITLQSNKEIECWSIKTLNARGTVILFHGYGGQKASMLDKSDEFIKLGFNTLLVDFMGSGGSEGNQTTIGYREAEQVVTAYEYLITKGDTNIYLFGTSLGAVAILKALNDHQIVPKGIIIECPFGSLYQTICARFRIMNAPSFPMAALLNFWGGVQNGFWAFDHNPTQYAKAVRCPALLLYGGKDEKVSRKEIDEIYNNIPGEKYLSVYSNAGHENYLNIYREQWISDVRFFINNAG